MNNPAPTTQLDHVPDATKMITPPDQLPDATKMITPPDQLPDPTKKVTPPPAPAPDPQPEIINPQSSIAPRTPWLAPIIAFFRSLRPRANRTLAQFAEQEITLPDGPREGLKLDLNFIPWVRLVYNLIDLGLFRRIFARGAVQSGKTLFFTVIPTIYHLFEIGENVIFAATTQDLAYDIFKERVIPILKKTRYWKLYPIKGSGSRGGKIKTITFLNGATLRFMGAGGGDAQRSSYTARVVIITEIDKMDEPGATSRETDPIRQFEARTSAYGSSARIYGECTTSSEHGRIYKLTSQLGTDTRIQIQCPHCKNYLYPIRENFTGWQETDNVLAAQTNATYICQHCAVPWTEPDRRTALENPAIVHKGQTIAPDGTITGPLPETDTLGLVWNAMHTPLVEMRDIARHEWNAAQDPSDSAMRYIHQFIWAMPYHTEILARQISYTLLAQHTTDYNFDPRSALPGRENIPPTQIPQGIEFTLTQIDIQKNVLYYLINGWDSDLTQWDLAWGVTDIIPEGATWTPTEHELRLALDKTLHLAHTYQTLTTWVDTGYKHEGSLQHTVRNWCNEQGPSVHALVGRAQTQMAKLTGKQLPLLPGIPQFIQCRLQDDNTILWFFDVDQLKDEIHRRLFLTPASPGYHHFPRQAANSKKTNRSTGPGSCGWIFSHYMRCRREIEHKNGKQTRTWIETGRHDLWDCTAYALGGAYITLADILDEQNNPPPPIAQTIPVPKTTINTKY